MERLNGNVMMVHLITELINNILIKNVLKIKI